MSCQLDLDLQLALEDALAVARLPDEAHFERWVAEVLEGQREVAELTIRIVEPEESRLLNQTYRHKESPTNVLSFPFEAPPEVDLPLLGDIIVCAEVVEREASEQGKRSEAHWAHMVVHGTLHLLGYDHLDEAEAELMEGLEIAILNRLGYPDPYIEQGATNP